MARKVRRFTSSLVPLAYRGSCSLNEATIIAIIASGYDDDVRKGREGNREGRSGLTGERRGQRRHEEWFNGAYRTSGRRVQRRLHPLAR